MLVATMEGLKRRRRAHTSAAKTWLLCEGTLQESEAAPLKVPLPQFKMQAAVVGETRLEACMLAHAEG